MTMYEAKQFSVDSGGAYLVNLYDSRGDAILFPRATIDGKRRGGAHVCLPYFGPDAAGVLPQHGFGRDVEWSVEVLSDNEIRCVYEEIKDGVSTGFYASILYKLFEDNNSFVTALTAANQSSRSEPFAVTPGFHPYFAVDPEDTYLNGGRIQLTDYEPFKSFPESSTMTLHSGGRTITVSSQDLRHMIVWTDKRGDYLCVEPTLSGNGFDSTKTSEHTLGAGAVAAYSYSITWE